MNQAGRKLRVGFDARWHNESGVGRYVAELLGATSRAAQVEMVIYEDVRNRVPGLDGCDVERIAVDGSKYSVNAQVELARRIAKDGVEVFHSPFYVVPLTANCPVVVTIHDVIPFLFPIHGLLKSTLIKAGYRMAVRKAEQVITVSENTAADLKKILGVSTGKITVVHNAAARVFQPQAQECEFTALKEKYGVTLPYVVAASASNWRTKNLEGALRALVTAQRKARFQTVIYGPQQGFLAAGGRARWQSLDLLVVGQLEAGKIAALFRHARGFIMPSFYEGFGLPVMEAMACGCPVVTSSGGSLGEVAGDGAEVFDPADTAGMAAAVARLVTDEESARKWRAAALRRAGDFSWERAARETMAVYHRAYCGKQQSKSVAGS